jgi:RNA polymerase-binding protein DksA
MPGQAEADATEETAAVLVADPDAAQQTAPAKAAPAKQPVAKKAPAEEPVAKKAPAEEPVAKKARAEKPAAKKARAEKPVAKKASAAKAPAANAAAKKPVAAKSQGEPEVTAAVTVAAPKAPAAKTPRKKAPARAGTKAPFPPAPDQPAAVEPAVAPVPTWSETELDGFRAALELDISRLREELNMGAADMADLLADSSDGAGDDQADAGSKTLEREQEMSVNANARDLLDQSTHALHRLEAGTYGICESCGTLIPAARLRAFPRATLCIACKQAEERR